MAGRSVVVGVGQDVRAMFWPWSMLANTGLNHPTRDPAQDCGWVLPDFWCLSKSGDICLSERHFQLRSDDYDYLLHNVNGGRVQRKRQHPSPSLDEINPALHSVFDEKLYGERLRKELNLSHLPKHVQTLVQDLIIKYWSVFFWQRPFCSRGRLWIIDTGTARPISVSKIHLILSSDSVSTLSYWMLWQGLLPTQYRVATMLSKSPSVMDCYGGYLMPLMVTIKFVSLNVQRRS